MVTGMFHYAIIFIFAALWRNKVEYIILHDKTFSAYNSFESTATVIS